MFYCEVIEYEAGWGSKPDGYLIALSKEAIQIRAQHINESDSYDLFYRFSPIRPCQLAQHLVDKLESPDSCIWVGNSVEIKVVTVLG